MCEALMYVPPTTHGRYSKTAFPPERPLVLDLDVILGIALHHFTSWANYSAAE